MSNVNKSTIERLLEFMEFKCLNDNRITSIAGLSVGLIGRARKNKSGLHSDTLEKILFAFPDLNPTWLLTGKGDMIIQDKNTSKPDFNNGLDQSPVYENLIEDIFNTQKEIYSFLKKSSLKNSL